MTAAGYAARASRVALLDLAEAPNTLVVERYDRVISGDSKHVTRFHQEDVCQALGLDSGNKYAATNTLKGNDPTYAAIVSLLQKYALDPESEKTELLRQLVVNLSLGNWDAHAKNTSFLYRESMVPTLAPLYDVVPIAEVEPRTLYLSMRVNGLIRPEEIMRCDVVAEASSWGMDSNDAEDIIDDVLCKLEKGIKAASIAYPAAAARHEDAVLRRICKLRGGF